MSEDRYLKARQEYIDRYDLNTIVECLKDYYFWQDAYKKHINSAEGKKFSAGDKAKGFNWITQQYRFQIIGKRYERKEETIQKWMVEDTLKQSKFDNTPEPKKIYCSNCKKIMRVRMKYLETLENPLQMMFLFECPSCKKKKWIYENGSERESTPDLCPKCKSEADVKVVKEGKDKVIWKTTCSSCGFTEKTVTDFKKSREEQKQKEQEDKYLLDTYRQEFCSEEKGKEAFEYIEALKIVPAVYEEEVKKYDNTAYQAIVKLKKISVLELEQMLNKVLVKERYIKLAFDKPDIGQHVVIPFNVQDADSSRRQTISISQLQKIIKDTLEGTNWRLMSDGVSYRLGYISGRLKGYEREEDFFELAGKKKEPESSKIDHEMLMKYGGHSAVQIARFMGEFKGIKNIRERRLKHEPDGFFLDSPDEYYSCGICKESTPGNKTWWNLDGVRCADCQRNIVNKIIPEEIHKNDQLWIQDWQLTSDNYFNIPPSTIRKLKREGLLVGRALAREDGTIYCTIYLIEENKEFLKKYPCKPKNKMVITDLLGNKIEL